LSDQLLEAAAPADFLSRVQALDFGEVARLAGGVAVKRAKTEDDRDAFKVGRPSTYREEGVSWEGEVVRTPELAVSRAFMISAQSEDPESIGGQTSLGRYSPVMHGSTPVRIRDFTLEGKAIVEPIATDEPITLAAAPRRVVDPRHLLRRVREDEALREETGKPGTNFKQVTPENRKRINPIVRHYMKMAHPFTACVRDNTKRFGPERAKRICAVVKDMGAGTTKWRKGNASLKEVDDLVDRLLEAAGGDVEGVEALMLQQILLTEMSVDRRGNFHDDDGKFADKPGGMTNVDRAQQGIAADRAEGRTPDASDILGRYEAAAAQDRRERRAAARERTRQRQAAASAGGAPPGHVPVGSGTPPVKRGAVVTVKGHEGEQVVLKRSGNDAWIVSREEAERTRGRGLTGTKVSASSVQTIRVRAR
jgi:hypothetical protein